MCLLQLVVNAGSFSWCYKFMSQLLCVTVSYFVFVLLTVVNNASWVIIVPLFASVPQAATEAAAAPAGGISRYSLKLTSGQNPLQQIWVRRLISYFQLQPGSVQLEDGRWQSWSGHWQTPLQQCYFHRCTNDSISPATNNFISCQHLYPIKANSSLVDTIIDTIYYIHLIELVIPL